MKRKVTTLCLAPAALALAALPARAEMKTQWVDYSQGDTKLKAYMAYDDKVTGKRPAIFVVHDRAGKAQQEPRNRALFRRLRQPGVWQQSANSF